MSNLSLLNQFNHAVSYRNTQKFEEKSIINSNVMLEIASNLARDKTENKYNKNKLIKMLPEIRKMTLEEPKSFYPRLKALLLDAGIVLIGLPNLKNASLQGATKKFKNGSVLLLITDRNKDADIFWFSLIHELAHIHKNDFYSDLADIETYIEKEKEADEFARNLLISLESYQEFIQVGDFSKEAIITFAQKIEVHPGIVVGRLQNERILGYHELHDLKVKYSFSF